MAKFTSTKHADQVNDLVVYWRDQNKREVEAGEWFMAALTLGSALEAMFYAYFIVWSGDDDPSKDGQIPSNLVLDSLIEAAKEFDLLTPVKFKDKFGEHAVQDVVQEIRHMRNNIHAGVALRNGFNPAKFAKEEYMRLQDIFDAVVDNFELAF
jgi:hypothetical protein